MKKILQKSAILFGTKSNAYLQINRPIFAYSWLFLAIFAYLRICSKSPQIYFTFHAKYPCLFLPIFCHLTCDILTRPLLDYRNDGFDLKTNNGQLWCFPFISVML